jgi:hypothetical protein
MERRALRISLPALQFHLVLPINSQELDNCTLNSGAMIHDTLQW